MLACTEDAFWFMCHGVSTFQRRPMLVTALSSVRCACFVVLSRLSSDWWSCTSRTFCSAASSAAIT